MLCNRCHGCESRIVWGNRRRHGCDAWSPAEMDQELELRGPAAAEQSRRLYCHRITPATVGGREPKIAPTRRAWSSGISMRTVSGIPWHPRDRLGLAVATGEYHFSDPVRAELKSAGWTPGRKFDISDWVDELGDEGYRLTEVAAAALTSYGGLELGPINVHGPNFSNDDPLIFDPILAGFGHYVLAEELERELGGTWYPLGEWLSSASVFVDWNGWTVATGMEWIWELGSSVEEAVEFALMAHRPLVCLRVLSPGVKPWPPP
jgi:SUKH-3 immunity protein of toxin-antitoxin system